MRNSAVEAISYDESKKYEYEQFLQEIGTNINFDDNTWICDKRIRCPADRNWRITLNFSAIPINYLEIVKYYAIIQLMKKRTVPGVVTTTFAIRKFLEFLNSNFPKTAIEKCNFSIAASYKNFLDNKGVQQVTKKGRWACVNAFFRDMNGWNGVKYQNPFSENPYFLQRKYDVKYIPNDITKQLDSAFYNKDIFLHLRCIYWILRLIPSRINEVLAMKIDCLKAYGDHYCLIIPTWKQNGGHIEPIKRIIHLEDTGITSELINLIKEQQDYARVIQSHLNELQRDYLFVYQKYVIKKNGDKYPYNTYFVAESPHVTCQFRRVCEKFNIIGENGQPYKICTHQFRHNGITDRLAAGFTPEQIQFMTAHHGDAMIYQAYSHLDLLPETILQKQKYVLNENSDIKRPAVLFGGRILNMDKQLEMRLLRNIRAHRVMGGICSDITGCKSDMTQCLECEYFVPDVGQLLFFEEQAESWAKKAEKFQNLPLIRDTALKNVSLYQSIVKKTKQLEVHDE